MREFQKFIICGALFCLIVLSNPAGAIPSNSTGNKIWDANLNSSIEYTWTPQSFSGFYYNADTGEETELLTVNLSTTNKRTISPGNMTYETRPVTTDFKYQGWGKYQSIIFMTERYFAGYSGSRFNNDINLMSDEKLLRILIDDNERKSLYTGSSFLLEEGYELEIKEVDKDGKKVLIELSKNGELIGTDLVGPNGDYTYKKDLGLNEEVAIIAVHLDNIFKGTETNAVFISGVFQISDELSSINSGDAYGKMEITSISPEKITMKNREEITLSKGKVVEVMGKLKLMIANNDTLRFSPFIEISEPGNYVLRGTVAEGRFEWTPMNFEGFYYNIDEGIGSESLTVEGINGRTIEKDKLQYKSKPEEVRFEHEHWGKFKILGFLADKYFAGYPKNGFSDGISLVSNGELAKVLIDSEEKKRVYSGSSLLLEEGYELKIKEINAEGSSVFVSLYKNGSIIDNGIVASNGDYVYRSNIGSIEDVPLIVVHIEDIFKGIETNAVFIKGIFQISQEYITIDNKAKYGIMEITDLSANGITMKNTADISLPRSKSIAIMGNIQFHIADSNDLRYYPFIEKNTTPLESLDIDVPKTIIEGETISIGVSSRGGGVENAVVHINKENIGTTSEKGIIKYTASGAGKFEISASKDGFISASKEIESIAKDDETRKISIKMSADRVYEGDKVTFSTVKSLNEEPVSGIRLLYDGKFIGNTSDDGKLEYVIKDPGIHKIKTVPDGFLPAEYNIDVIVREPNFIYSGLHIMPIDPVKKENVSLSVEVTNTGTAPGKEEVELKINGSVVDIRTVALEIGESTFLNFTYMSPQEGIYEAHVGTEKLEFEVQKKSILSYVGIGLVVSLIVSRLGYPMVKKGEKRKRKTGL